MDRKVLLNRRDFRGKQTQAKLMHDEGSQSFMEGQQAARDAFGKIRALLMREKQKRRSVKIVTTAKE